MVAVDKDYALTRHRRAAHSCFSVKKKISAKKMLCMYASSALSIT